MRLRRAAYIDTEAACALAMHLTTTAAYGSTDLLSGRVLLLGLLLPPAALAGAWTGKNSSVNMSDRIFVVLVEIGLLVAAGLLFVLGG